MLKLGACGGFIGAIPTLLRLVFDGLYGKGAGETAVRIFLAAIIVIAFYFGTREWLAHRLRAEDLAQIDGGFGDQFPAELTVVTDGKPLGTDRGVVWFADGLMGFSGKTTSYVLAASDLAPVMLRPKRDKVKKALGANAIQLRGAPKYAYIVVNPLSGHVKAYRERLKRLINDAEVTEAERFWPPLHPFDEQRDALVLGSEKAPLGPRSAKENALQ